MLMIDLREKRDTVTSLRFFAFSYSTIENVDSSMANIW